MLNPVPANKKYSPKKSENMYLIGLFMITDCKESYNLFYCEIFKLFFRYFINYMLKCPIFVV